MPTTSRLAMAPTIPHMANSDSGGRQIFARGDVAERKKPSLAGGPGRGKGGMLLASRRLAVAGEEETRIDVKPACAPRSPHAARNAASRMRLIRQLSAAPDLVPRAEC